MKDTKLKWQVTVKQEIPYDCDDDEFPESTGITECYVAGCFISQRYAELFREALADQIAEATNFVVNAFTPCVFVEEIPEAAPSAAAASQNSNDEPEQGALSFSELLGSSSCVNIFTNDTHIVFKSCNAGNGRR